MTATSDGRGATIYEGPQPSLGSMLEATWHNLTGLVPSMCEHGAAFLVVDPDDVPGGHRIGGTLGDGRMLIAPRPGSTWVRAKYMTGNMTCVMEQGQPRPDDLTTAAMNRPSPAIHDASKPVRMWAPEVYDPAVHGPVVK